MSWSHLGSKYFFFSPSPQTMFWRGKKNAVAIFKVENFTAKISHYLLC